MNKNLCLSTDQISKYLFLIIIFLDLPYQRKNPQFFVDLRTYYFYQRFTEFRKFVTQLFTFVLNNYRV